MDFSFPEVPESIRLIVLAVLQGIAEFLPISSSGHLNVFSTALGGEPSTRVNIALHFGTLLSILVYYRKKVIALLFEDRRVIPLLIIGTIPAAIAGVTIKTYYPWLLKDLMVTGVMLAITGIALCFFQPTKKKKGDSKDAEALLQIDGNSAEEKSAVGDSKKDYFDLSWKAALLIGVFQAFALMPGISRSGFTILAGVMIGLKHKSAATFSFLLAIPAILGATVLELLDLAKHPSQEPTGMVLLATLVAFVVGLGALALLVKMLDQGKLHWFALWVLPLGLLVIIWELYKQLAIEAGI